MRRAADRHRVGAVRPAVLRRRAVVRHLRRGTGVLLPVGGGFWQRATHAADESQARPPCGAEAAKTLQPPASHSNVAATSRPPDAGRGEVTRLGRVRGHPRVLRRAAGRLRLPVAARRSEMGAKHGSAVRKREVRNTKSERDRTVSSSCSPTGFHFAIRFSYSDLPGAAMGLLEGTHGRRVPGDEPGMGDQLGSRIVAVADDVRAGLLRHRDDGHRRAALRHRPLRRRRVPRDAAAGRTS